jgi:hypothetical protein
VERMGEVRGVYNILVGRPEGRPLHAMEAHGGRGGISPTHT